ncbi:MAG: hypothetical protein Q8K85_15925 [Hyphomicrobium sp.]|nr:hypothetical protein [Hyphomicrobium sp.]
MFRARMNRTSLLAPAAACAAVALLTGSAFAQAAADTTRIVPSETYGATVTMEEGVRVFRPFPSERHVIINPEGRTPLSLNYYDPVTGVPVRGQSRR